MGAPRAINFNVIAGKSHIFYSVSLTDSDICEVQAFKIEFDVEFQAINVGIDFIKSSDSLIS